ncbi:MAG: DUF6600 domain-containing protein [Bryobacteraceae bacterium]
MRGLDGARWFVVLAMPAILLGQDAGRGVARLSLMGGEVSIRRGDSGDQIAAALNAPLVVTDRVYTGPSSRAEIQFDYANFLRLASNAEVRLTELVNHRYQIQIAGGLATFTVLRDSEADVEISTPAVAVRPIKRGSYRILVGPDGETEIIVRAGEAEIFTPAGSERLRSGQMMRVRGTEANPEFQIARAYGDDDWDRWNHNRDRDLARTSGYRYASRDIAGIEDLDNYGTWESYPEYGHVWVPRVTAGWAPYRLGRWVWLDWWGWSWVSHDPWGWAPYHYGRWFYGNRGWCWWPGGGIGVRHSWSPGLVAFFGWGSGGHVRVGFGSVGWVPLGPRDPFHPWWGRGVYSGFRNRTHIDNSVNIVNNVNIYNTYRNSRVENAITAVDGGDFVRGRGGAGVRLRGDELNHASVVRGALPIAPERESLRMSDRVVSTPVRAAGNDGRFYSRRQVAAVDRVPFEDQRAGMQQISRRASDMMSGQRGSQPAALRESAGRVEPSASGYGRSGGQAEGGARVGASAAERGWRRADEPVSGATSGYGRAGSEPATGGDRSTGRATSGDPTQGNSGWRRFGEPRTIDRGADRGEPSSGYGRGSAGDTRTGDSSRRFGEPRTIDRGTATQEDRSSSGYGRATATGSESRGGDNWRRFGDRTGDRGDRGQEAAPATRGYGRSESRGRFEGRVSGADVSPAHIDPARSTPPSGESAPAAHDSSGATERVEGSSGYGRASGFGDSGNRSRESRSNSGFSGSRSESLNVSPPIVRQRSEYGGGGGSWGRGNPTPRASAPSSGGGGSGSHASAPSSGGGDGGGRSSGGGGRGGDGGGRGGRGR